MELTTEDPALAHRLICVYNNRTTVFLLGVTWYIEEHTAAAIYHPVEHTFVLQAA